MIKSEIINSIMYAMKYKDLPEKYKTELKKIIWGFLWNNKPDKVKRNACTRMTHYGGLGMLDIEKVIQISRIQMLERIMNGDKEKWKLLPLQYFKVLNKKYGVEMFVLKDTKSEDEPEFNKIPINYQEMINVCQTLKQKERSCLSVTEPGEQYMWCNHLIHIDGKIFNDSKWAKK